MPNREDHCDEHVDPSSQPCATALVAGTLALMTTWADPCPTCTLEPTAQRRLLARKVASNLFYMKHHPAFSPALRQVMAHAHARWLDLAQRENGDVDEDKLDTSAAAVTLGSGALH
jgi:hypothetical protein